MATKKENDELTDKILRGLEKSYKDLLASKRRNNEDLIILQNDQIVRIKP
ncbi:MAG: hypothetical protein LBF08_03245 [Dysgonamonadaceae bacterium]|jgi:hypothetical protein|nr:hypothetical protein [Dysgonamonadaceae bacterium]